MLKCKDQVIDNLEKRVHNLEKEKDEMKVENGELEERVRDVE